jgi:hypothetical protein
MRTFLLAFAILLISSSFYGQSPIKWGEIPSEDLRMTEYPADPEAEAVVLCDFGHLSFDFSRGRYVTFELLHHRRVKVLDRQGFSEGDISIPFYSKNNFERIMNLKVQVFSPDGEKTELGRKDFYEEEINDYYSVIRFAIPKLEEGSVIEYKYTLISEDIFELDSWYFQEDIPVRWSELQLEIPEWYRYVFLMQGNLDINDKSSESSRIGVSGGVVNVHVDKYRMVMADVPAMREEAFITTMDDYYAKVEFQLSSIESPFTITEEVLSTWALVGQDFMEDAGFGLQFTRKRNYKTVLEALNQDIQSLEDPREKSLAIYSFLQEKMDWNGVYHYRMNSTINEVFTEGAGTSAELNLMLLALLRNQGLEAFPLLVSTRSNGQMIELYPIMSQFNHVFIGVIIDGEALLLDLAQENGPAGLISVDALNGRALSLYDASNPLWVDIPTPMSQSVYYGVSELSSEGVINGTMKTSYDGYKAISLREGYASASQLESAWTNILNDQYNACQISDLSVEGLQSPAEKMAGEFHFELANAAQVAGDYIYVNPIVYSGFEENPFTAEERLFPVDFPYPTKRKYIYNLQIPEGYTVDELPESIRAVMEGNAGLFQYTISDRGDNIQVRVEIEFYKLWYTPEEYHVIKNFYDLMIEKLSEPVVLRRTLNR